MLTHEFKYEIGRGLKTQTDALLAKQRAVAAMSFKLHTGTLARSLRGNPSVTGTSVDLDYPKYIRFLDMKRGRNGLRKVYKPVYGYLVGGVRRFLNAVTTGILVRTIEDTIKDVK